MKPVLKAYKKTTINGTVLKMVKGDLLAQEVEAIVNSANTDIEGGGGVDGRIHSMAGPELLAACQLYKQANNIEKIEVAEALMTDSFAIKSMNPSIQYIIHTVGPDCRIAIQWEERDILLKNSYINSLEVAKRNGIKTIAFPAISTGAFNYPFWEAQLVVVETLKEYLENTVKTLFEEIRLVYFSEAEIENALRVWEEVFSNKSEID